MFNNPGKKIKTVAIVYFWLITITSVILAFSLGIDHYYYYGERTVFHAEIFFSILIGGPLFAYITALLYVGFGELVENSAKTESKKEADEAERLAELEALEQATEAEPDPNLTNEEIERELEQELLAEQPQSEQTSDQTE